MFKYLLTLSLSISFIYSTKAQSERDTIVFYVKNDGKVVNSKEAADYVLLILPETPGEKEKLYPVLSFYPDGKRKMIATSSVRSINFRFEGTQMMFFPNGKRSSVTTYKKGVPVNEEVSYYPNGKVYNRKKFQGYQTLLIECRDSTGILLAENGNGKWIEFDESFTNIVAQGPVKNGLMEGLWYRNRGRVVYTRGVPDRYTMNFTPVSRKLLPEEMVFVQKDSSTLYISRLDSLQKLIYKNINFEDVKQDIGKQLYIGFFIEKDGSFSDFNTFLSSSEGLNEKLKAIINLTAPWRAPLKNIRSPVMLPLFFSKDSLASYDVDSKTIDKTKIPPQFPEATIGFGNFLQKNFRYPSPEQEHNVTGKVYTKFVVEKDGTISDLHITRAPSIGLAEEVLRVMRLSPKWIPGSQDGLPKRMQYTVPINFTLGTEPEGIKNDNAFVMVTALGLSRDIDVQAEFPGGRYKFSEFLTSNIKYPKIDIKNNVRGKVYVSFIVQKDGTLTEVKSEKSPSVTLAEEAVRVVKLSPPWDPALSKGMAVQMQYTVAINFGDEYEPAGRNLLPTETIIGNATYIKLPSGNAYKNVEVMPKFPGGSNQLRKFLLSNLQYPSIDKLIDKYGRVEVNFIVENDGSISNIEVQRSPSKTIQDEVIRVIELFPKWIPGSERKRNVRVQINMSLDFVLNGNNASIVINNLP